MNLPTFQIQTSITFSLFAASKILDMQNRQTYTLFNSVLVNTLRLKYFIYDDLNCLLCRFFSEITYYLPNILHKHESIIVYSIVIE